MGVLVERHHDVHFFAQVPVLCSAVKNFSAKRAESFLKNFGQLFVKHDMYNQFGLTMAHRHLNLNSQEILVETINKDKTLSVAMPWALKDGQAVPKDQELWNSFDLKEKKLIAAQTWSFAATGDLKAFEFYSTNDEMEDPPVEFVAELFKALKEVGLEKTVGLRRIHKGQDDLSSWETTPEDIRASITQFGRTMPLEMRKEDMITVLWKFDQNGEIRAAGDCGNCCYRCNNCNHCNHCRDCQCKTM